MEPVKSDTSDTSDKTTQSVTINPPFLKNPAYKNLNTSCTINTIIPSK